MGILFVLLSFVALIALAVGLVKPSTVKCATRGKATLLYGGAFIGLLILGIVTSASTETSTPVTTSPVPLQAQSDTNTTSKPVPAPVSDNTASRAQAQKELDDLMALSKKAGLVRSFEFSNSAHVIYVEGVWYTQDVKFKKDFMANVSALRAKIEGGTASWDFFQVKDAYTDEMVGEVTAFSGALKVYK